MLPFHPSTFRRMTEGVFAFPGTGTPVPAPELRNSGTPAPRDNIIQHSTKTNLGTEVQRKNSDEDIINLASYFWEIHSQEE